MVARFDDSEVLQATGATLARSGAHTRFEGVCTDSRALTPGCLFVALKGERFDGHSFLDDAVRGGAAGVLVNAGHAALEAFKGEVAVYTVTDSLAALGRLARFHRDRFRIPLAAITGSNGKTTTKELLATILAVRGPTLRTQGNLNNEIGVPLTLFGLDSTHVAAVIEMGMNHEGEIARLTEIARPDAGLITVVQPAHLEGLGTLKAIAKAKGELFLGLSSSATVVVNLDDSHVVAQAAQVSAKQLTYGRAPQAHVRLASVESRGRQGLSLHIDFGGKVFPVMLRLVGEHNAMNAAGAFALAIALGYSPEECVQGLEGAQAFSRRLNLIEAPNGVTVVDDCYNANPASMQAALDTVFDLASAGRAVAVLGDMLELGPNESIEHAQIGLIASGQVELLALFGPRMKQAHRQATQRLGRKARHFEDVESLVAWLGPELQPKDFVLVKGSRGMHLERVVEALVGHAQPGGH